MLLSPSLPRPDLGDRRTQLALGASALVGLLAGFAVAIGTGNLRLTAELGALACAPLLLAVMLTRPYVLPYGLYVMLVPFDNMLKLGSAGTLTKLLGIATAVFVALYAMRVRGLARPPLSLYLWLAYAAWALLSVIWAPVGASNLAVGLEQLVSVTLLFTVLAVAPIDEPRLRGICVAIVLGGVLASLYGMYLLHQSPAMAGDEGRLMLDVGSRTIDPNHFANSLLAPLAIALVTLLHARRPARIAVALGALAILLAGIAVSLSREALLGAILVGVVTIAFSRRRLLGFALALPAVALVPLLVPGIGARMALALTTGGAGRTSIWHVGWLAFREHPFFGWGIGTALDAYDRNYLAVFQLYNAGWHRPPHNTILHAAIELGIVGAVLLLLGYAATFRQLAGIGRGDGLYDLRVAFTAALVALGFVSLFIDLGIYKYFWLVLAAIAQLRTVRLTRAVPQPVTVVYEPPPAVAAARA